MKFRKILGTVLLWYVVRYLCENVLFAFGWGILLFRCIYHPLCLSTAYRQVRRNYPVGRGVIVRYSLFLAVYCLCYVLYLPDRIDFFIDKIAVMDKVLEEKKKQRGTWDESDDIMIVGSCYITDYPDRVPLIADKKRLYMVHTKIFGKHMALAQNVSWYTCMATGITGIMRITRCRGRGAVNMLFRMFRRASGTANIARSANGFMLL